MGGGNSAPFCFACQILSEFGMWRLLFGLLGAVSAVVASTPRVICTSSNPAELSGNVTLTCELRANLEVLQVTWQKKRGKDTQNMVTYSEKYGTHVTEQFKKRITVLETKSAISSISSITITKLEKEDEACYNCLFNAYPNGAFTGEVCLADLTSTPRVICTSSNPAELSGNVTLTCEFRANMEILQVTWQKKRGKDTQNMVTYSEKYGTHITEQFEKHITVLESTPAKSSITITKLEEEDEACYSCLFNAYLNGTFTGEVCLTDLKPANEVLCSGKGNNLRIDLNPQEIQTRTSVQLIKKKIGDVSTVKGQYSDPSINPTCEFWLEKESGEENQNNPAEDADKFFIECSASGHKKFLITWSNEGQPVSREDNVNTTGNTTTVTSTLMYTMSSLPADHRIICTITLSVPPEAYPEKYVLSGKEPTLENFDKGDAENKAQQQRAWERYPIIASAGFPFLVILIFILFYYKVWKREEAKVPMKPAGNGPEAPTSSIKKLVGVINGWDSPKFSTENDSGPAIPAPINKGKPSNSDQRNPKKTKESSVKKRNRQGSEKSTSAIKKLDFK